MGSLADWNTFFRTNRRPNFGDVHTKYGTPEFESEYLRSETLKDFHHRLLDTLTGSFEMLNLLVTGNPGIGKTSFLYYLRHHFEKESEQKYAVKIFHSNHARGFKNRNEVEERIQKEIIEAWETLYKKCGHHLTFNQIDGAGYSQRKTLNELSDFYIRNKGKFPAILIFAVDDVDLLETDELHTIIKLVISNLEVKSVKKWFFVRPQTYLNYDQKTKDFLQGFFPDIRELPRTRLYDLVRHRIRAAGSDPDACRIPFSPHLCSYIEGLVDSNIRRAFPALEHILGELQPPHKGESSEEFVKNYT